MYTVLTGSSDETNNSLHAEVVSESKSSQSGNLATIAAARDAVGAQASPLPEAEAKISENEDSVAGDKEQKVCETLRST